MCSFLCCCQGRTFLSSPPRYSFVLLADYNSPGCVWASCCICRGQTWLVPPSCHLCLGRVSALQSRAPGSAAGPLHLSWPHHACGLSSRYWTRRQHQSTPCPYNTWQPGHANRLMNPSSRATYPRWLEPASGVLKRVVNVLRHLSLNGINTVRPIEVKRIKVNCICAEPSVDPIPFSLLHVMWLPCCRS